MASLNDKAVYFVAQNVNPHCKVQSYWRPLGFCIDFIKQVRVAMEKYNPTQLLASNSKAATPYKGGYQKL